MPRKGHVHHNLENQAFAIKVMKGRLKENPEIKALRSVCLQKPHNEHIIHIEEFWYQENLEQGISRTFIRMELCDGDLESYLRDKRKAGENITAMELAGIMTQMLVGLENCHIKNVCHRDLKPSNGASVFRIITNLPSTLC